MFVYEAGLPRDSTYRFNAKLHEKAGNERSIISTNSHSCIRVSSCFPVDKL